MHKRTKLWSSLSLAALVGSGALAVGPAAALAAQVDQASAIPAGSEGGEGEGEGLSADVNPATDDVAFLTQLGLMRGHLLVGLELYRTGHIDHARTHMKHPKSELYAELVPAFEARGNVGFGDELEDLAEAVEADGTAPEAVESAYKAVLDGITAAEQSAGDVAPVAWLKVVVNLLRTAGEEYGIGVVDGKVVNGHEYQDAFGFTTTAQARVAAIDAGDDAELAAALEAIDAQIQDLFDANLWPAVMPPETLPTEASLIYGAAARIEIVVLGLD